MKFVLYFLGGWGITPLALIANSLVQIILLSLCTVAITRFGWTEKVKILELKAIK